MKQPRNMYECAQKIPISSKMLVGLFLHGLWQMLEPHSVQFPQTSGIGGGDIDNPKLVALGQGTIGPPILADLRCPFAFLRLNNPHLLKTVIFSQSEEYSYLRYTVYCRSLFLIGIYNFLMLFHSSLVVNMGDDFSGETLIKGANMQASPTSQLIFQCRAYPIETLESLNFRWSMFPNYIKFFDRHIMRLSNCERFGRVVVPPHGDLLTDNGNGSS